jgi:ribonucleases P/MRP protein subunit RPP40
MKSDFRQIDLIVTEKAAGKLKECLKDGKDTLRYARVYMKLSNLVEGDFFDQYIKAGMSER